jgi:hypothetical protein
MVPAAFIVAYLFLPATFHIDGVSKSLDATWLDAAVCVTVGGICVFIQVH